VKTETITIRINSELLEKIRDLSQEEIRPLSKQIEYLLTKSIKESK
jgi:hypothetical protein